MEHGIPSSGVLCMELLRQIQPQGTQSADLTLPRASIIQQLSVFLDCLDWIPADTPSIYKLCERMSNIIRGVLDRVLNGGGHRPAVRQQQIQFYPQHEHYPASTPTSYDYTSSMGDQMTAMTADCPDLDWTDMLDWSQESWMDYMERFDILSSN